jgi:predicted amidohydrolase YtcJ
MSVRKMLVVATALLFGIQSYTLLGQSSIQARRGAGDAADLVLLNGTIITVDSADQIAQAVAIQAGQIVAVGSNAEIQHRIGPRTRTVDLQGFTATPGLIDAHLHLSVGGVRRLTNIDLSYPAVNSIADVRNAVALRAGALRTAEWIQGSGWDEGKLQERRMLAAHDLDDVAKGHPAWLIQTMGHYGVANSEALRLAQIDKTTADPPGGVIDRYPDGTPTGVLKESAQNLVSRLVPPPSQGRIEEGIKSLASDLLGEGMTAAKDPDIGRAHWDAYRSLRARNELPVRVVVLWNGGKTTESSRALITQIEQFSKPYQSTGDDHLISGGVKLFMDGSGRTDRLGIYGLEQERL